LEGKENSITFALAFENKRSW